jgi:hypothetical protein
MWGTLWGMKISVKFSFVISIHYGASFTPTRGAKNVEEKQGTRLVEKLGLHVSVNHPGMPVSIPLSSCCHGQSILCARNKKKPWCPSLQHLRPDRMKETPPRRRNRLMSREPSIKKTACSNIDKKFY